MNNQISYTEAFLMYMKGDWYEVLPFDDSIERNFVDMLIEKGFKIKDLAERRYRNGK